MKRRICIVTTARSEYGVLRWLIRGVHESPFLDLLFIVTGGHLSKEQGHTLDFIRADNIPLTIVDFMPENSSVKDIVASLGRCSIEFSKFFASQKPDCLVVLGDRYELLPICTAALVYGLPIAHISGGDTTEGAIDDAVRNSITMMASWHFPGVADSAANIVRMRGSNRNIFVVGELGLDNFVKEKLVSREELAESLGLDFGMKWVLMTYHSETKISLRENIQTLKNIIRCLNRIGNIQIVITKANLDFGGLEINQLITRYALRCPNRYKIFSSLGQKRYLSFMKEVWFMIGNSSSGIIEAPFLRIPVINIGDRQKGRYLCGNVRQSGRLLKEIAEALNNIDDLGNSVTDANYWGDGNASQKILEVLEKI